VKVVLDADVLVGALDGTDAHHARARALFITWLSQDVARLISVVNLSEVLVAPAADKQRLRRARAAITALGVSTHRPNEAIAVDAARLRALHPISLPDAYCLATAQHTSASVASFDQKIIRAAKAEQISVVPTPGARSRS
jgi:predicted nucleic acid-binding protein